VYPTTTTHYAWCILNEAAQKRFGHSTLKFYKDTRGLFEVGGGRGGGGGRIIIIVVKVVDSNIWKQWW